jgi:hypothetical protein
VRIGDKRGEVPHRSVVKMIRTDGAAGTATGSPVTATDSLLGSKFFSGHRDGTVRSYDLDACEF